MGIVTVCDAGTLKCSRLLVLQPLMLFVTKGVHIGAVRAGAACNRACNRVHGPHMAPLVITAAVCAWWHGGIAGALFMAALAPCMRHSAHQQREHIGRRLHVERMHDVCIHLWKVPSEHENVPMYKVYYLCCTRQAELGMCRLTD